MSILVKEFFYQPNGPIQNKESIDLQITHFLQKLGKVKLIDIKYVPSMNANERKTMALLICETED